MTMTRFVPFRSGLSDVAVLQNRLNSIFHDFARPTGEGQESLASGNFVPAVDVYEDEQKLVLKLEVPGIKQEDLDIRLENQTLTSAASPCRSLWTGTRLRRSMRRVCWRFSWPRKKPRSRSR